MSNNLEPLTKESLPAYLVERGQLPTAAGAEVRLLTGGVSNVAFWVEWQGGACVVKQPLPKLAVAVEWVADVRRIIREAEAMEWLRERVGPPAIPELLDLDRERLVLVMEAIRPPAEEYKACLLRGEVSLPLATRFGRLLGTIHSVTSDAATRDRFGDTSLFEQLRLSPYYDTTGARHPDLKALLATLRLECLTSTYCLVHGDYSPKNALVRGDVLTLLDYEVAQFGNPSFDLAFALTHYLCKALHVPGRGRELVAAARAFRAAYREQASVPEAALARAGLHLGAIMLARMDGKSPLEYFTDPARQKLVRRLARTALLEGWTDPETLIDAVEAALP